MKQFEAEIKDLFQEALEQHASPLSFEETWQKSQTTKPKIFWFNKLIASPMYALTVLVICCVLVFGSYKIIRKVDATYYYFVDDTEVIGRWQSVACVEKIDAFNPDSRVATNKLNLDNLVFLKQGKMLSMLCQNDQFNFIEFSWIKEHLFYQPEKVNSRYKIKQINGKIYLFFKWKRSEGYYVLQKVK